MSGPSGVQTAHEYASQVEEGRSPQVNSTENEKIEVLQPVRRSSTMATLRQAVRRASSNLFPQLPPAAEPQTRCLEDYPRGYPSLSFVLNSDDSFMMYRQFGQLHSRVLLYKQDQLREMEQQLLRMDNRDSKSKDTAKYLGCRKADENRPAPARGISRAKLMENIEGKLLEYGRILKQTQEFQNMAKPRSRDHASISRYMKQKTPLVEDDEDFILRREDMISLRDVSGSRAWLDGLLEGFLHTTLLALRPHPRISKFVKQIFVTEDGKAKTKDESFYYFDRTRVNTIVTIAIAFFLIPALIAPIYILYELTVLNNTPISSPKVIIVLLVSVFLFSMILGIFTKAKRHETLAAAAGYCAVLIVFLSNPIGGNGNNNGGS